MTLPRKGSLVKMIQTLNDISRFSTLTVNEILLGLKVKGDLFKNPIRN